MLTCQAEHVDSTCRCQGSKAEWTQEMLRLVEADEVGFPMMGTRMGDAAGLYRGLILINATSADKATFSRVPECHCYRGRACFPVPGPLPTKCVGVLMRAGASCDSEDLMRWDAMGMYVHWLVLVHTGPCCGVCVSVSCHGTDSSGFVGAGVASLAFASYRQCTHHIQMHRVPGAKAHSPLLAPFPMLRLLLVPHQCWWKESPEP